MFCVVLEIGFPSGGAGSPPDAGGTGGITTIVVSSGEKNVSHMFWKNALTRFTPSSSKSGALAAASAFSFLVARPPSGGRVTTFPFFPSAESYLTLRDTRGTDTLANIRVALSAIVSTLASAESGMEPNTWNPLPIPRPNSFPATAVTSPK